MNALYQQYRDRAEFFIVYIGEAHPSDAWQVPNNLKDRVIVASPANAREREAVADVCMTKLGLVDPRDRRHVRRRDGAGVYGMAGAAVSD